MSEMYDEIGKAFLDDVEFFERGMRNVTKLSYWNPEYNIQKFIYENISYHVNKDIVEYIFSYEISSILKQRLLEKFSVEYKNTDIIITHSGTASIYSVCNLMKQLNINEITTLAPIYFSLPHVCKNLDIHLDIEYLEYKDNEYILTNEQLEKLNDVSVIWLNNPVYCTSVFYKGIKDSIHTWLKQGKLIIIDESLCLFGYELIREFNMYENLITIVSPHKALGINGMKFSGIITSNKYSSIINEWLDIAVGCLSSTNYDAIHHFLSSNFAQLNEKYINEVIKVNILALHKLLQECDVAFEKNVLGGFISVYFPKIPSNYFDDNIKLEKIMKKTQCSFISGSRNSFNPNFGFCFRINVSRVNNAFLEQLKRIINYLKKIEKSC